MEHKGLQSIGHSWNISLHIIPRPPNCLVLNVCLFLHSHQTGLKLLLMKKAVSIRLLFKICSLGNGISYPHLLMSFTKLFHLLWQTVSTILHSSFFSGMRAERNRWKKVGVVVGLPLEINMDYILQSMWALIYSAVNNIFLNDVNRLVNHRILLCLPEDHRKYQLDSFLSLLLFIINALLPHPLGFPKHEAQEVRNFSVALLCGLTSSVSRLL